jgi:hypothetical protein
MLDSDALNSFIQEKKRIKSNQCYKDIHLGITKVKIVNEYHFPFNFTWKLHQHMKLSYNSSIKKIIVLGRKTKNRIVANNDELVNSLHKEFSSYSIQYVEFEGKSMSEQIEIVHSASVFIGVHGSGLAHVAWMRFGTILIEIMVYKFRCRNWYEKACAVYGVKYLKYEPEDETGSPGSNKRQRKCWETPDKCLDQCLDLLRDQNVRVNITNFLSLLSTAI